MPLYKHCMSTSAQIKCESSLLNHIQRDADNVDLFRGVPGHEAHMQVYTIYSRPIVADLLLYKSGSEVLVHDERPFQTFDGSDPRLQTPCMQCQ
jgi:hypothetical protein